jgi:predicted dehydrogenase
MVEECESRGVLFAAGLVPRNYPQHWQARDLINSGEIGEVQSINLYDGNGQAGCHGINMALHFANDAEVDWLTGWVGGAPFSDSDPADESFDNPEVGGDPDKSGLGGYILFDNGVECFSHRRNTVHHGIEVVCSDGVFFSDFFTQARLFKKDGAVVKEVEGIFPPMRPAGNPDGSRLRDPDGWVATTPGLKATIEALVEALDTGDKPKLTTGEDLRRCLEICIAMRESHRRDFAPMRLPLEDRTLKMYPVDARWNYKKEELGRDWYMDELAQIAHL